MSKVLEKLLRPANLLKIPEFTSIFNNNVYTDLDLGQITWFATQLGSLRGTDALSTHTMPTSGSSGRPSWYELLDKKAVLELVNRTVNPYRREIAAGDVDILERAP